MIYLLLLILLVAVNIKLSNKRLNWFFQLSHFLAGFLLAGFLSKYLSSLGVISSLLVIGIVWELWEYIAARSILIKRLIARINYSVDKESLKGILADTVLNIAGALAFFLSRVV